MGEGWYPKNPNLSQELQSDVDDEHQDRAFIAHLEWTATEAVAASDTGVLAATDCTTAEQEVTSGLTDPATPRNITATTTGTNTDVANESVVITGTDIEGNSISETLTAFTVNTNETVTGAKAFATVTKVTIPAMDGTGCDVSVGWGDKLGLPYKRACLPCIAAYLGDTLESTAATIASDATNIESNTIDLNSALDGSTVDAYLVV